MPTHFHLLIRVAAVSVSELMHLALGRCSQYFNYRRETFGSVFQPRFKDNLIENDRYLMNTMRYIHLNPVQARLVAAPEYWHGPAIELSLEQKIHLLMCRPLWRSSIGTLNGPALSTRNS